MTPAEIKALRIALGCSTRELAVAIDVEQDVILSWERGETFPTKRSVDRMQAALTAGPSAIPKKRRTSVPASPFEALADPELWVILRKLLAHPDLRAKVSELATSYTDPNDAP